MKVLNENVMQGRGLQRYIKIWFEVNPQTKHR